MLWNIYHLYHLSNYLVFKILGYDEYDGCIYCVRAPGFSILCDPFYLYIAVGESFEFKLLVFLYLYVGGSNELSPRGPFLHLPPRWILPADCRRPQLSLSWSGSPKGAAEWSKWAAWTYAVRLIHAHIRTNVSWITRLNNGNYGVFSSGCFALQKLKKEAAEEGAYLICWSAVNYENLVLIVHNKNKVILKKLPCRDNKKSRLFVYMSLFLTEWLRTEPQAVSD